VVKGQTGTMKRGECHKRPRESCQKIREEGVVFTEYIGGLPISGGCTQGGGEHQGLSKGNKRRRKNGHMPGADPAAEKIIFHGGKGNSKPSRRLKEPYNCPLGITQEKPNKSVGEMREKDCKKKRGRGKNGVNKIPH